MLTRPKSVEKHRFRRPMAIVLLQRSLLCQCRVLVFFYIYLRLYVPTVLRAATRSRAKDGSVEKPKRRASIPAAPPLLTLMANCKFITHIAGNNDGHYSRQWEIIIFSPPKYYLHVFVKIIDVRGVPKFRVHLCEVASFSRWWASMFFFSNLVR